MPPPAINRVAPMPPAYELLPVNVAPPMYRREDPPTYDQSEGRHDGRVVRYERLDSPPYTPRAVTPTSAQICAARTCTNAYAVLTTLGAGLMLLAPATAAGVYYGARLDAAKTERTFNIDTWNKSQTGVIALATVTGLALFSIGLIMTVVAAKCLRNRCARSWHA